MTKIKKTVIIIVCILIGLSLIPILAYLINFYDHVVSDKTENWAQFGDYVGGLVNPLIGIVNIAVVAYLALRVDEINNKLRIEDINREKQLLETIHEPVFNISMNHNNNGILSIKLKNDGDSSIFIKNIKFVDKETSEEKNWLDFNLDLIALTTSYNVIYNSFPKKELPIGLGQNKELLVFEVKPDTKRFINSIDYYGTKYEVFISKLRKYIHNYKIIVDYSNKFKTKDYEDSKGCFFPIITSYEFNIN